MHRLGRERAIDVAIAAAIGIFSIVEIATEHLHPVWASAPLLLAGSIALVWRRRYPAAIAAVFVALSVAQAAAGVSMHTAVTPVVALLVLAWSVGAYEPRPRAVLGIVVIVGGIWISIAVDMLRGTDHYVGTDFPWIGALLAMPWLVGLLFHSRTRSLRAAESAVERLERERLAVVAEERARIARELHDVIAHSVSVMVVQAGAAEEMLKRDAARAGEPIRAVQETGRQALVEMSRLVGLLRDDGHELGLAPQPGLDNLEELLAQVRAAGLAVELEVEGDRLGLPLGVDVSAYRVVQEALTNALKHAGHANTRVRLRYGRDSVEVEVEDDGAGTGNGHVGGHGLVGMRERVSVFGGEFTAGPRPEGGFAVRARLPLGETPT
jgi:signal transduction histidine kinase